MISLSVVTSGTVDVPDAAISAGQGIVSTAISEISSRGISAGLGVSCTDIPGGLDGSGA